MNRVSANELREGMYLLVDEEPYLILKESTSMPGKHGHAKKKLQLEGVFNEKKRQISLGSHEEVEVPDVKKNDAQVVSVEGNIVQLMDLSTYETFEAEKKGFDVENGDEVIYTRFGDRCKIEELKEN